jgi:hypothetical protein
MPGNAKTSKMLLSTATVMIGPLDKLHALNPVEHSIGLVKNVMLASDPQFTELTQGLTNDVVMSVKTNDGVRLSMEVYEFTLRNIAYAAGLDGSGVNYDTMGATYTTSAAPAGTTVTCSTSVATFIATGDYIFIQNDQSDVVHIAKVATVATTTITLATGFAIPAGAGFTANSRVGKVRRIDIGGDTVQPEVSAKIVGLLPKQNEPVTILVPKLKITRGLSMSFSSDNFSNMPFEFTPYAQNMEDPMFGEYGAKKMIIFPR